jgi:hypothetical protein
MTCKARAKLTEADALEIFLTQGTVPNAAAVSSLYGVSEKAVRDIWTGRTWSRETCHLDTSRPIRFKKIGRPTGSKDVKPRKKRKMRPNHSLPVPETESEVGTAYVCPYDQNGLTGLEGERQGNDLASIDMPQWHVHLFPCDGEKSRDFSELAQSSIDELLFNRADGQGCFDHGFSDPFRCDWVSQRCLFQVEAALSADAGLRKQP